MKTKRKQRTRTQRTRTQRTKQTRSNKNQHVRNKDKLSNIKLLKNANGTKLLLMQNRNETASASIYFFFKVGSKNETPDIAGISHFIEHMIFKGSPKYKSYLDISKTFDANGISFNAYTSKDITAYHYKFLATEQNMKIICQITSDMIFNPLMREDDINNERNVIIQELKDDEDDIDEYISDQVEKSILAGHPLACPIIGNIESLHKIGRKELLEYHNKYYRTDNLVIALSGNFTSKYIQILNKYFSTINHANVNKDFKQIKYEYARSSSLIIPYIEKNINTTIECFDKNLQQDYLYIIFKTRGAFDPMINIYKMIANILGGNMSSRLFVRMREQLGLVYSIKCSMTNYEEVGYSTISAQNEHKSTIECLKNIFIELDKLKKNGIKEQELVENKKNYVDIFKTNFDDIEYENEYYAKQILFNLPLEPVERRFEKINQITTENIQNIANELFNYNKMHILTFGKIKKQSIENIIKKYC